VAQVFPRSAPPAVPLAAAVLLGGIILLLAPPEKALLGVLATVIFTLTFLNTELALHLIILAMLLSPEAFIGGGGIQLGRLERKGSQAVFRMEDILLAIVGLSWFTRTALHKELGLFLRTPLNRPIAAYVVANALSTAVGIASGTVRPVSGFFFVLKYVEYFVLYFMMVNNLRDGRQLHRFLFTGFATCAIASVIGILQIPSGERVAAPFEGELGEPNTFGGYLVFMLALALALWLQSQNAFAFFGWVVLAGLITLPLLFTLSRSSWLATIPMLLTLLILSQRKILLALPLAMAVVAAPLVFPQQVMRRVAYTYSAAPEADQVQIGRVRLDSSTSARLTSFKQGLEGWTEHPILGYGVTGFSFMDAQYIRTLVETGIVGFGALLWLIGGISRAAWHSYTSATDPKYRALAMGYLAGFIALLVHGIGANTFIIVRIMEPFWFFTAIVVMLPRLPGFTAPPVPAGGLAWRAAPPPLAPGLGRPG
jgi:O-antigen ligase